MKAELTSKGTLRVVDPDTGEIVATTSLATTKERIARRYFHYKLEKLIKAEKPILENMIFKDIERNSGQPIEDDDFRIHEVNQQMTAISPAVVFGKIGGLDDLMELAEDPNADREQLQEAILQTVGGFEKVITLLKDDAVKKTAIADAVKSGELSKEEGQILNKAVVTLPKAKHFTRIERKKFDTKEGA